ncbi:unnamed protein product [Lathyrus sativus]|nr:unnamed protein product [Lathyrus sativus]
MDEAKKKESSSSLCNKELFNVFSSHRHCESKRKGKCDDHEVQQANKSEIQKESNSNTTQSNQGNRVNVATVVECLGKVMLSINKVGLEAPRDNGGIQNRKWNRRKIVKNGEVAPAKTQKPNNFKRQLVDVMITEGLIEDCGVGENKQKQTEVGSDFLINQPEVVLDGQHRLF